MIEWITLFTSVITLLVTAVVEFPKISRTLRSFQTWYAGRKKRKTDEEFIVQYEGFPTSKTRREFPIKSSLLYFFILTIASGVAGIVGITSKSIMSLIGCLTLLIIPLYAGVVVAIAKTNETAMSTSDWDDFLGLAFFITIIPGLIWGLIANSLTVRTQSVFEAGMITSALLSLGIFVLLYFFMKLISSDGDEADIPDI